MSVGMHSPKFFRQNQCVITTKTPPRLPPKKKVQSSTRTPPRLLTMSIITAENTIAATVYYPRYNNDCHLP